MQNFKGKHIDIHYHYVFDTVKRGKVNFNLIFLIKMVANLITKGLSMKTLREHLARM